MYQLNIRCHSFIIELQTMIFLTQQFKFNVSVWDPTIVTKALIRSILVENHLLKSQICQSDSKMAN
jgi:hypothetical protein